MAFRGKSVYEDSTPIRQKWLPEAEYRAKLAREADERQAKKQAERDRPREFGKADRYPSERTGFVPAHKQAIDKYIVLSEHNTAGQIVGLMDEQDLFYIEPFVKQTLRDMAGALADHVEFQTKFMWIRQQTGASVAAILEDIMVQRWPLVYKWLLAGPPYNGLRYAINALWRKHGAGGFTPTPRPATTPQMSTPAERAEFWRRVREEQSYRQRWAQQPVEPPQRRQRRRSSTPTLAGRDLEYEAYQEAHGHEEDSIDE